MLPIHLDATGFARASPEQAWTVLTDYEALPRFVPGLVRSHVARHDARGVVLEQESRAGFLFFTHSVHLTLRLDEHPPRTIDTMLLHGDLRHFDAHWELEEATERGVHGTRIRYHGTLMPPFPLPPLLGDAVVHASVRRTVAATIAEIERRLREH